MEKKTKKMLLSILGAVLLVGGIIGGAVYHYSNKSLEKLENKAQVANNNLKQDDEKWKVKSVTYLEDGSKIVEYANHLLGGNVLIHKTSTSNTVIFDYDRDAFKHFAYTNLDLKYDVFKDSEGLKLEYTYNDHSTFAGEVVYSLYNFKTHDLLTTEFNIVNNKIVFNLKNKGLSYSVESIRKNTNYNSHTKKTEDVFTGLRLIAINSKNKKKVVKEYYFEKPIIQQPFVCDAECMVFDFAKSESQKPFTFAFPDQKKYNFRLIHPEDFENAELVSDDSSIKIVSKKAIKSDIVINDPVKKLDSEKISKLESLDLSEFDKLHQANKKLKKITSLDIDN